MASATSPEHFIAHKSCSQLIKQCWSEPRNHENVKCSSHPFPLIRDFCCCFFRGRVRSFTALNVTLTLVRMLPWLDMGFFCTKYFLGLGFLTQNCSWWASCSPALTSLWNFFFSPQLCFNPSLGSQQGWNYHSVVLGTTTPFLPAKDFAGHMAGAEPNMKCCVWDNNSPSAAGVLVLCAPWAVSCRTAQGALPFLAEELCEGDRGDNSTDTIIFPPKASWSNTLFLLKVTATDARFDFNQGCSDSS